MFNRQRTSFPNRFLSAIGFLSTSFVLTCLSYSYKLLCELCTDTVNPVDVCEKINHIKGPEYCAHFILFLALILRGWWVTGILNFPFLFYNFAQWYPGRYLLDSTRVFNTLSQIMWEVKTKTIFFLLVVFYNFWEWVSWVPPIYVSKGKGYNKMKNVQIFH
mmetsp:Transcript_25807/g.51756  ORF Transcript_25807/g.51756 Transcript_25807/m.51756 type:complete len:161 (-) Transcript_25807:2082-2564(-)